MLLEVAIQRGGRVFAAERPLFRWQETIARSGDPSDQPPVCLGDLIDGQTGADLFDQLCVLGGAPSLAETGEWHDSVLRPGRRLGREIHTKSVSRPADIPAETRAFNFLKPGPRSSRRVTLLRPFVPRRWESPERKPYFIRPRGRRGKTPHETSIA